MQNLTGRYWILIIILVGTFLLIYFSKTQSFTSRKEVATDTSHAQIDRIPTQAGKNLFLTQSNNLTTSVDPELVDLDSQIITCSADVDSLLSSTPTTGGSCVGPGGNVNTIGKFLSGQCCGAMKDTKEHHENLEALQKYKNLPDVPLDPFKTPIDLAKKWIDYDKTITLSVDEQEKLNQAVSLSKEGPCCCKCWHYFVNEGIGKKMIREYEFTPQQVADFWDVSDICS